MMRHECFAVIAFVSFSAALSSQCLGWIGETEAEIRARYGEPVFANTDPVDVPAGTDKLIHFKKDPIHLSIGLSNGKSVVEMYDFRDKDGQKWPIGEANIAIVEGVLVFNSQGHSWKRNRDAALTVKGCRCAWERSDGGAAAIVWDNEPSVLEVTDWRWMNSRNNP